MSDVHLLQIEILKEGRGKVEEHTLLAQKWQLLQPFMASLLMSEKLHNVTN
jgi:hypothetical protein